MRIARGVSNEGFGHVEIRRLKILKILVGLVLLGVCILLGLFRAARHVPDFYRQALSISAEQQQHYAAQFQDQVLQLKTTAAREQRFETAWSEAQINGWLATTVADQHAHQLPPGMRDLRVALEKGQARVGCRYRKGKIDTVAWLVVDVVLTDQPNVLELRLRGLKAGLVPVSINRFQEQVTASLKRAKVSIRWIEDAGDVTARLQLPGRFADLPRRSVRFEKIELRDGILLLSGSVRK